MLDRPTQIKRIEAGEKFDFLCFYGHAVHEPVAKTCFSQWYPAPFTVNGVLYPTAEHWMMVGKALSAPAFFHFAVRRIAVLSDETIGC